MNLLFLNCQIFKIYEFKYSRGLTAAEATTAVCAGVVQFGNP
jgi:hypothetical protein